ncbi:unnamed protein product [Trichogramma brassicae]|uniref:Integrase catalytic domain-containing protein n=1 Tax=Trichogramma brassicae TaxID=86971 RepID=A0A6H5ISQ6_9HYME|nr:unnamed protein product [Trichogramma brassicae]
MEYISAKSRIRDLLALRRPPPPAPTSQAAEAAPTSRSELRIEQFSALPNLALPKFSGKQDGWESFKQRFSSLVRDKESIPKVAKLQHLLNAHQGPAALRLRGMEITEANFDVAWDKLMRRYDNKRIRLTNTLEHLIQLPMVKTRSAQELSDLIDHSKEAFRSLKELQCPVEHYDAWIVHCVVRKLDANSRESWEISREDAADLPTYSDLINFLERRIHSLEQARPSNENRDAHASRSRNGGQQCVFANNTQVQEDSTEARNAPLCDLCQSAHWLHKCFKFLAMSQPQRLEFCRKKKLCLNCLHRSHFVDRCPSNSRCWTCQRKHHTKLHADDADRKVTRRRDASGGVVLTNWRFFKCAGATDVEKMFRQIRVHEDDVDFQRVLWLLEPSSPIQDFRCTTVTYGMVSAPFLALRVMQQLAEDGKKTYPEAAGALHHQLYVDDVFFGADSLEEALSRRDQIVKLLESAGMRLEKGHIGKDCVHCRKTCTRCNRRGHIAAACRSQGIQNITDQKDNSSSSSSSSSSDAESEMSSHIYHLTSAGPTASVNNVDYADPARMPMYLKVRVNAVSIDMEVDSGSFWSIISDNTRRKKFANFEILFARHGLPHHLVTDNGTQYTSEKFKLFVKSNNIKHTYTAPWHPDSNGAAENFVGTFKDKVHKMLKSGKNLNEAVTKFLFDYRRTVHGSTERTPAYMMYKRELRTKLDCLQPDVSERIENAQLRKFCNRNYCIRDRQSELLYTRSSARHPPTPARRPRPSDRQHSSSISTSSPAAAAQQQHQHHQQSSISTAAAQQRRHSSSRATTAQSLASIEISSAEVAFVLDWIARHPSRWPTFVANRVSEVQTKLPDAHWNHVRTMDNSADCATRGLTPLELSDFSLWWSGPRWLVEEETSWPKLATANEIAASVLAAEIDVRATTDAVTGCLPDFSKFSSFNKIIKIISLCRRWRTRFVPLREDSSVEWMKARLLCFKLIQAHHFSDELRALKAGTALHKRS